MSEQITVLIKSCGEISATFKRLEYEAAKAAGRLDHLIDAYASDMDEETWIVEPDGTEINPYV